MNNRTLDAVTAILSGDMLLIPITNNVTKLFENKKIEFQISIRDNKIILESPEILENMNFHDNIRRLEIINE